MEALFNTYTLAQWLMLFFVYCFLGWIWETSYVSVRMKRFTNRGFMHGPMLPIYGSGAITMLFTTLPVKNNAILVFVVACISATALELCTGTAMEAIFKVRYWDYTRYKINYKGYICLKASLLWGIAGVLLVFLVNRPISAFILGIPRRIADLIAFALTFMAACDFGASFRDAMDVREILMRLTEEKDKQLKRIEKRVDVMTAIYADELGKSAQHVNQLRKEYMEKLMELKEASFDKVKDIKEAGQEYAAELFEGNTAKKEWAKSKMELLTDTQRKRLDRFIINNPDAHSKNVEISEMIEILKEKTIDRFKKANK